MRRLIILLFLLPGLWVIAQDEEQDFKTIFGSDFSSGGYGAPEIKLGTIYKETGLLLGGRGGWIIGHKFVLGGAGYGLTTNNSFNYTEDLMDQNGNIAHDSTRNLKIDMGYGGLLLEYIALPKKAVHLAFPVVIGAGGTSLGIKNDTLYSGNNPQNPLPYTYIESSAFFIVEPGASVELNMTKFFRLNIGASYRFITGTNFTRLKSNDLSGLTFTLALKFGVF